MQLSRRAFLRLAGKAGLAAPFAFGASACALGTAGRFDADTGLSLGYVTGDVTPDGAVVWLRAQPESSVSIQYGKDATLVSSASAGPIRVAGDSDFTAKLLLSRLDPATVYYYRAAVAGKKPGLVGKFVTAPTADATAVVKFCFGGDTREGYRPFTIMDAIRAKRPDFFVHLGDTIYADRNFIASELPQFWSKYRTNRDDPPSQRLFSETSVYAIWDDHEVRDNYEAGHPLAAIGQRAFLDYWPVRRDGSEPNRIYRSFRWGRALELFLLDGRQYRERAKGTMLGSRQKEWLLDGLARSSALFKIVATPVPFYGGGRDRWEAYARERSDVMRWIEEKKITGVVFVSADLHYAAVARIPGRLGLKEIVTGPLAAQLNVFGVGYSESVEFFANKTFNYAMITIDPEAAPSQMLVEILDEENRSLYKTRIDAL
ncbi:MAG TPA: alkaline phosphatase D family protein [Candidatus Binatia bacterium]|jgi:alkaline phosphatase D